MNAALAGTITSDQRKLPPSNDRAPCHRKTTPGAKIRRGHSESNSECRLKTSRSLHDPRVLRSQKREDHTCVAKASSSRRNAMTAIACYGCHSYFAQFEGSDDPKWRKLSTVSDCSGQGPCTFAHDHRLLMCALAQMKQCSGKEKDQGKSKEKKALGALSFSLK